MNPSRRLAATSALLAAALAGCKQGSNVSTVAYVIGPNDIETLDAGNKGLVPPSLLHAAVLLSTSVTETKRKFCSGTLLPPAEGDTRYRVITNHHCFAPDEDDKRKVPDELLPGACTSTKIYFGFFRDEIASREVGDCLAGSLRTDFQGDLGLFTLKENPSERFKPVEIWKEDQVPTGRKASIVHFPTIEANAANADKDLILEPTSGIKLPVAQVTLNDCETLGVFPPSEWGLDKSLKMGFKHSCDLKKGSSGSALWDNETNTILGVNWGGITLKYTDPDRTEVFNVATNAKYIRSFLANQQQSELERLGKIEATGGGSANAELASGSNAQVKKKGLGSCASIGPEAGAATSAWLGIVGLLAPLALAGRRRRD